MNNSDLKSKDSIILIGYNLVKNKLSPCTLSYVLYFTTGERWLYFKFILIKLWEIADF